LLSDFDWLPSTKMLVDKNSSTKSEAREGVVFTTTALPSYTTR